MSKCIGEENLYIEAEDFQALRQRLRVLDRLADELSSRRRTRLDRHLERLREAAAGRQPKE